MTNDQSPLETEPTPEPVPEPEPATPTDANDPEALEAQLAAAEDRYLRALADYQNFQRRAANNEKEARVRGVRDVLTSLLPVLDNADITLSQDTSTLTVDQLVGGVTLIRDGLLGAMKNHGVSPIAPEPGDEFEPGRHEAIMQTDSEDLEPGTVAMTLQGGYAIGEQIVRPAKVSVAKAPAGEHE